MRIVAFAGPSLPESTRSGTPTIEWRPPAEAGDLLRLQDDLPEQVCLIDGYFDHRPAVRHKEILLLLSQGVTVVGASSIGALRAAEMSRLGMIGVGLIFRAYTRGSITGDDEVALIHGPPESDWRPLSVPLVDVRATVCRARRTGVLSGMNARLILGAAARLHYIDRDWMSVVATSGISARSEFATWLKTGAVGQKQFDARACIEFALTMPPSQRERPPMVRTAHIEALAASLGVEL